MTGKYEDMGKEIGELTQLKNVAYGDSFDRCGDILQLLFPEGIKPAQYRDALGVVRVIDKLFRIANRKNAFGESPWKDIAGYGILGAAHDDGAVDADTACDDTNDHAMMARRHCVPGTKPELELKIGSRVVVKTSARFFRGYSGVVEEHEPSCIEQLPWLVALGVEKYKVWFRADELEVIE